MSVRVNDAREHHSTRQVDAPGGGATEGADRLIGADRDDRIAADRERLGDAAISILGVNSAVKQDEIGGWIRRKSNAHEAKRQGQCGGARVDVHGSLEGLIK